MRAQHTPLKLHLLVVAKLRNDLGLSGSRHPSVTNASEDLQTFNEHQEQIGWGNLFCGFAAKSLCHYMDLHLPTDSPLSGSQWVCGFLKQLQTWVTSVWFCRCKLEHNKHKAEQSATRQQLLQRITNMYSLQHKVPFSFQKCFDIPVQQFEKKSDNFLHNWLSLHEAHISKFASESLTQLCMLNFLVPSGVSPPV